MEKESLLTKVCKGVKNILVGCFEENLNKEEFEANVKTLTDTGHGADLYNKIKDIISEHLELVKSNVLTKKNEANFLEIFCDVWYNYDVSMFCIREILIYMESFYINKEGLITLRKLGTILFRDIIFSCVSDRIRDILLDMIMANRRGEEVVSSNIRSASVMLVAFGAGTLSVYEEVFENIYLDQANEYYNNLRLKLLGENEADEYVRKIDDCINEEMRIVENCLEDSTLAKLRIVLKKDFAHFFLSKGQYPHQ